MIPNEQWTAVDRYYSELLVTPTEDPAIKAALQASVDAGLPPINVSPPQGKLLHLLAKAHGAKRILEIGTLGAYSTIWMAKALPKDGRLITLEYDPKHAAVARANLARAGLTDTVELMLGPAIESLPKLFAEKKGPFDFIFIDADKVSTADYFGWALKLSRIGSVIIVDNVVREGAIVKADSEDASVQGIRRFNQVLAAEKRVNATAIQTVGSKGYDGFVLALVTA